MTRSQEIYFCDNPKRLSCLELRDIPADKREAIRRLHRLEDRHNVRLLFFLVIWAVAGYAVLTMDHVAVQVASCLIEVSAFIGCTVLLHEASHGLLFKYPALNRFAGLLCGLLVLLPVSGFWTNHKMHHARRGSTMGKVSDTVFDLNASSSLPAYLLGNLAKAYGFITVLPIVAIVKADWKGRVQTLMEYVIIVGFLAIVFKTISFQTIWKLWMFPLLIGALITQIRAIAEHGLTTRGNVFTSSRTVQSNRFVSFMMCNINYHLEHHLFPGVPWYNLPKVHALLGDEYRRAGSSVYRSYTEFFIDFFKASWRGIIPNARVISEGARIQITC